MPRYEWLARDMHTARVRAWVADARAYLIESQRVAAELRAYVAGTRLERGERDA